VTLRGLKLLRSAGTNGASPLECGGDLLTGSNERCHAAVYLRNVDGATLEGLTIDGSSQAGIVAHDVGGLAIIDTAIRNAGDELFEHGLILEELRGDCRIAGTTVEKSASRHLMLHNSRGTLALTIERSKFADTGAHGHQAALVTASGEAAIDLRVRETTFARNAAAALEVTGSEKSKITVRVTGNTFDANASAVSLAATNAADLDYLIADNPTITGSKNAAVNIFLGSPSSGVLSGTIARNVIGISGVAGSGAGCVSCAGILLSATGRGSLIADVSGNIVQQTGSSPIYASASQGTAQLHLTATKNLLREGNVSAPAIRVQSGARADDATSVCADIGGSGAGANKIEGAWEPNGAIHLIHRFGGARFQLAGLTGGNSDAAAAAAVAGRNGGVKVRAVLREESKEKGFEPAVRCTMPALTQ
jgi:Right handed beta helix region